MKTSSLFFLLLTASVVPTSGWSADEPATTTYRVEQNVTLSDIPSGAKTVKWWIAIPADDRFQDVLDFSVVSAPGKWSVVGEPDRGNRFMLVEVANPGASKLTTKVEFVLRRKTVMIDIDPAKVGPVTETHRRLFHDELRADAPHMEVTPQIARLADEACKGEKNVALQAKLMLNAVADYADHYSKDPSKPNCGVGDAAACIANAGGCCTDLHSMFIAMARARGIPSRLQMGYRLREPNAGKETDPGYRCWAEYFVPGYGWVPADIVEADDPNGLGRARWLSGLTARRLWLNEGREFDLAGRAVTSRRVNTVSIAYAEIDGVEARVLPEGDKAPQHSRTVRYVELGADDPARIVRPGGISAL